MANTSTIDLKFYWAVFLRRLPYFLVVAALFTAAAEALREGIAAGFPEAEVLRTVGMLKRNEYKRRQAPVVLRVSQKAYGSGRRIPIVHRSGWGL